MNLTWRYYHQTLSLAVGFEEVKPRLLPSVTKLIISSPHHFILYSDQGRLLMEPQQDSIERIKINDTFAASTRDPSGTLYSRFRVYFQYFLNQDIGKESENEFNAAYVSNTAVEQELESYLSNIANVRGFLVGSTGIGKTTYIRKKFGISNAPRIMPHNISDAEQRTLILPFQLDTAAPGAAQIHARVISKLRAAVKFCADHFNAYPSDKEIINFIRETGREDLLNFEQEGDEPLNDPQRLLILRTQFEYAYLATKLKYIARTGLIDRVLVVVDNIESFPFPDQITLVIECLAFVGCFNNNGSSDVPILTSLLVACRPATRLRMLEQDPINAHNFESFDIRHPVNIQDVAKGRLAAAMVKAGRARAGHGIVQDKEAWNKAYEVLEWVISQMTRRHGQLIVGLHNNNFRDSFGGITNILANSNWYEEDQPRQGAFKIEESSYHTTEARIMRALVLRNGDIYKPQGRNFPVANVLHNGPREYTDFIAPLICKYFIKRAINNVNGAVIVPRTTLVQKLNRLLEGHRGNPFADDVINYFLDRQLLRTEDDDLVGLPKLFATWRMLKRSSILFEFFRDDTYIPELDVRAHCKAVSKSPYCATASLRADALFSATAELITQIAVAELQLLRFCQKKDRLQLYSEEFGNFVFSRRPLGGLTQSLESYYRGKIPDSVKTSRGHAEVAVASVTQFSRKLED